MHETYPQGANSVPDSVWLAVIRSKKRQKWSIVAVEAGKGQVGGEIKQCLKNAVRFG